LMFFIFGNKNGKKKKFKKNEKLKRESQFFN